MDLVREILGLLYLTSAVIYLVKGDSLKSISFLLFAIYFKV